jgi:hypothetical protein
MLITMRRRHSVAHPFHDNSHKDATQTKIKSSKEDKKTVRERPTIRYIHREACLTLYIYLPMFFKGINVPLRLYTIQRSWTTMLTNKKKTISVFGFDYRLDNCRVIVWRNVTITAHNPIPNSDDITEYVDALYRGFFLKKNKQTTSCILK